MKGALRKKKKRLWKPVAAGFLAMYLATMGLVTLLVKEKFEDDYIRMFNQVAMSIYRKATEQEENFENNCQREEYYKRLVNEYFWSETDPQLNISVAVYDKEQKLLAKSYDAIGDTMYSADTTQARYGAYVLDDYLTFEQKEELAEYYWKEKQIEDDYTLPQKYGILIRTSPDGEELYNIYVQEMTWQEGGEEKQYKNPLTGEISSYSLGLMTDYATGEEYGEEKIFYMTDSEVVWEWTNLKISEEKRKSGEIRDPDVVFPYMTSYERWHRWSSSKFLHDFPQEGSFSWDGQMEYPGIYSEGGWEFKVGHQLKIGYMDGPSAYILIRMEERTWVNAINYMKQLYVAGLALTLACMFLVIDAFNRIYSHQMALEETRRDFTNAMAHELKTPLGIIRNFAENLIERNMEEKRDYYLTQIIGQTEEMDRLVAEMIEISKLDSEELALKKETISFGALVREEMERFAPMIDEKNIQVQYEEKADFLVEGDREYLEKAVFNLISNAVDYNVLDGRILVRTEAGQCVIENTGKQMEEDELLHAFDLFFTGDKSRGKKGNHMGIGLFLVKKIAKLHGMKVILENVADGIRGVVKK
jgi:Signal transduction histidine kinase